MLKSPALFDVANTRRFESTSATTTVAANCARPDRASVSVLLARMCVRETASATRRFVVPRLPLVQALITPFIQCPGNLERDPTGCTCKCPTATPILCGTESCQADTVGLRKFLLSAFSFVDVILHLHSVLAARYSRLGLARASAPRRSPLCATKPATLRLVPCWFGFPRVVPSLTFALSPKVYRGPVGMGLR